MLREISSIPGFPGLRPPCLIPSQCMRVSSSFFKEINSSTSPSYQTHSDRQTSRQTDRGKNKLLLLVEVI